MIRSLWMDVHDLYAMLADASVGRRDESEIRKYAQLLEESAGSLEHKLYLATAHRAWGVLHKLEGEYVESEARLEQATDLFRGLDTRWQLGRTHLEMGELMADRSDSAGARQHYSRAWELFDEMGASLDAERARLALAIVDNEL